MTSMRVRQGITAVCALLALIALQQQWAPLSTHVRRLSEGDSIQMRDTNSRRDAAPTESYFAASNISLAQQLEELTRKHTTQLEQIIQKQKQIEQQKTEQKPCAGTISPTQCDPKTHRCAMPVQSHDAVKPHVDLLIGITSHPNHGHQRQVVRETWMRYVTDASSPHFIADARVAYFFFVGGRTGKHHHNQPGHNHTDNARIRDDIAAEVDKHGDVLWIDHEEEYGALANKSQALFRYAAREHNFTWFLKADDDTYIVVPRLIEQLRTEDKKTKLYLGQIRRGSRPQPNGKWEDKVFADFTGQKLYPPYAAGWAYVVSRDVCTFLSQTLLPWKHLPGEDVSTGLWLSSVHIHKVSARGFFSSPHCTADYVVSHYLGEDALRKRWESHSSGGSPCA